MASLLDQMRQQQTQTKTTGNPEDYSLDRYRQPYVAPKPVVDPVRRSYVPPSQPYIPPSNPPSNPPSTGSFTTPGAPVAPETTELDALRKARLEAALDAIGAQFGLQQGQIQSQIGQLKSFFDSSMKELDRSELASTQAIDNSAAERGLLRSGIYGQDRAESAAGHAETRAGLVSQANPTEGAEGTQIRDLMSQLLLLTQQQTAAESMAGIESEQGALDISQLLALFTSGLY